MKKTLVLFGVLVLCAAAAIAADVSGTWKSTLEVQGRTIERTFVLKQDGEKLTGKLVTPRGEAELKEGKVSGDEIEFKVEQRRGPDSDPVLATYKAKVTGDTMEGTSQVGDREPRPFKATRAKSE